ncbi:glutathione S-transferase family protein [Massilia glaciei]|uniref:Glutathione S-transferase domain-containing protein n=1 Tax=Massilia glaciei TaxID=1524097 RepID=A0A2U2I542_9BURK|nr:glutathione S-transferase domain-containing protein [Massilia glaciei]PWF54938.1 glutathione S-transferase domain-containing protein [Massilia glaciei]
MERNTGRCVHAQPAGGPGQGPPAHQRENQYFAGPHFTLVDAAFGPVFRYFDVYDGVSGVDLFAAAPKLRAWRAALAAHPSVRGAVAPDYGARLAAFTVGQGESI